MSQGEGTMSFDQIMYIAVGVFVISALVETVRRYIRRNADPVLRIQDDDPKMLAAIRKSQATLQIFWEAFDAKRAMDSKFAIKARLEHNGEAEHLWCELLERAAGACRVRLLNIPAKLPFEQGDIISIGESQITDWIFTRNDQQMGGETQRVLDEIKSGNMQPQI